MDMYTEVSNVWESSSKTSSEAKFLKLHTQMVLVLRQIIHEYDWSQKEAVARLNISQSRVSYIINGQVSKFNVEKLLGLLSRVGYDFSFTRDKDGIPHFITQQAA